MTSQNLTPYFERLSHLPGHDCLGRVVQVLGSVVVSRGPLCSVGESCQVESSDGHSVPAEVVGFRDSLVLSMPLGSAAGIRYGDMVTTRGMRSTVPVSEAMLGRVVNALGEPLDSLGGIACSARVPVDSSPPHALARTPIREPLGCGIRAIDAFLTCGRGQRVGIFGGSGVGKTTLIGMMTRGTSADVVVIGLIGERGREVGDFLDALGEEGRRRSVLVVSTSDESPLLRIRAALTATAIAESFSARGREVLLVVDSLTRFAMAQREVGLAAGEPPTAKGYTPSVFSTMARLVERAGRFRAGSITGFYTVLMEGDDQQDPLVDAVRSLLDGHIILDRKLAVANHYPPIAVLDSLSRLMPAVTSRDHLAKVGAIRNLMSLHQRCEDLLRVGAYQQGTDPELDRAINTLPEILRFLRQSSSEIARREDSVSALLALPV